MRDRSAIAFGCLAIVFTLAAVANSYAQPPASAPASAAAARPATPMKSGGPAWSELKPVEQAALKPLQSQWSTIDETRKRKWLKIAEGYSAMSAPEQERLHARMTEWARLSPQERNDVRQRYLEAKHLRSTDRQAGWEAYQALTPQERKALADRAAPAARTAPKLPPPPARTAKGQPQAPKSDVAAATTNTPHPAPQTKLTAGNVVQGKPGATTSLITKQPTPAERPTPSGPKIAASADVVDKTTLLPRAGPQKAVAPPSVATAGTPPARSTAHPQAVGAPPNRTQSAGASASGSR